MNTEFHTRARKVFGKAYKDVKLAILDEIHQQLDVVRVHEWVTGEPKDFHTACLVVRNDAITEITFRDADELNEFMLGQGSHRMDWMEIDEFGRARFYKAADIQEEMGYAAQDLVALARERFHFFSYNELDHAIDEATTMEKPEPVRAIQDQNVEWNDELPDSNPDQKRRSRSKVIMVLTEALCLGREVMTKQPQHRDPAHLKALKDKPKMVTWATKLPKRKGYN